LTVIGDAPLVNHALVLAEGPSSVLDPYVPDPSKLSWLRIGVPGHLGEQGTQLDLMEVARIKSGPMVQIVDADPPANRRPTHSSGGLG
jgi:hypothetical protein